MTKDGLNLTSVTFHRSISERYDHITSMLRLNVMDKMTMLFVFYRDYFRITLTII